MNIVRPGDHVVISIPVSYSNPSTKEHVEAQIRRIPEDIKTGFGHVVPFSMSWIPVGAVDSDPHVLFVIRNQKESST